MESLRKFFLVLVTAGIFIGFGLYYHFHAFDHEFSIENQLSSPLTFIPAGLPEGEENPVLLPIKTGRWLSNELATSRSINLSAKTGVSFVYDSKRISFRWLLVKDSQNRVFRLELGDGRLFSHFSIDKLPMENRIMPARCELNPNILDCKLLRLATES